VVTYPADFFDTVMWHDGSHISVADFVAAWIMGFDVGKEGSAIYDEAQAPSIEANLEAFKGYEILSTDPFSIAWYSDNYSLDAENNVNSLWPNLGYGDGAWHALALGYKADAAGELAFSADKAEAAEVEWMSYISGPSLDVLKAKLDEAAAETFIPYANVLGQYITAEEAAERYQNLDRWFTRQGHFHVGTGPYYLNKVFPVEKTLTLTRYQEYPDASNKWDRFGTPAIPVVEMDGPGRVNIGEEAMFDVFVSFNEAPYAAADIQEVKYLVFDATGALVAQGIAENVEDGYYTVTMSSDVTSGLAAGSNKLEVAVLSKLVSLPSFGVFEFVTAAP
jgi:peptide/nickel transport system substrate-binding protein